MATLALSIGCVALAVLWPGWFTTFRVEGSYPTEQISVAGNVAVSTAAVQSTNISIRLGALRGGATGGSTSSRTASLEPYREFGADAAALDPSRSSALGGLDIFLNGLGSFGDQTASSREPGFDFHTAGLTLGVDYKLTSNLILGAAFGYINTKAAVDAHAGHVTTDGYSFSGFGTFYIGKAFYVDAIVTGGWNSYDIKRNITGITETAKGDPDGTQVAVSVGAGYDFSFGALTVGPTARVNYLHVHIDSYRERHTTTSDLFVNSQTIESLTTGLGGQASYAISLPWGVVSPMARFEWEHEYKNNSRNITGRSVLTATPFSLPTNHPDRNYFNLGGGVSASFKEGVSAFLYYEAVLGKERFTNNSFTAGLRYEF